MYKMECINCSLVIDHTDYSCSLGHNTLCDSCLISWKHACEDSMKLVTCPVCRNELVLFPNVNDLWGGLLTTLMPEDNAPRVWSNIHWLSNDLQRQIHIPNDDAIWRRVIIIPFMWSMHPLIQAVARSHRSTNHSELVVSRRTHIERPISTLKNILDQLGLISGRQQRKEQKKQWHNRR